MAPAHSPWQRGPDAPAPPPCSLEVWRAQLERQPQALAGLLSPDERQRAELIISPSRRELWMRSRGVLRELLGRYAGGDASGLRFVSGHRGKPALLQDVRAGAEMPGGPLSFSASHSGEVALYAISFSGAVGVDVEIARQATRGHLPVARRAFGRATAARLCTLDPQARRREFLRLWVRREAERKCWGEGIWASQLERDLTVWVGDLLPSSDAQELVAVATMSAPARVRCWQFSSALGGSC